MTNLRKKRLFKLIRKGVQLCAPLFIFLAATILLSLWIFYSFIAQSSVFKAVIRTAPVEIVPKHLLQEREREQELPIVTTDEIEVETVEGKEYRPAVAYGSKWAVMNVDGWEKTDIPIYFSDDDDYLKKGACMSYQSRFPGDGGCTILSAHVNSFFNELEDVEVGDIVTLNTVYGQYRYEIYNVFTFRYDDPAVLYRSGEDRSNTLLFYTCYPRKNPFAFKELRIAAIGKMIEGKEWDRL